MIDPKKRGYYAVYMMGERNYCPGCGRSHWTLGLSSAECAFCDTALPYAVTPPTSGHSTIIRHNHHVPAAARGRFTINGRAG